MSKHHYAKLTCLFLVEGLRTRKMPLPRVVEIAEKFLDHVNLLDSERDFLLLVKELSKDFEELVALENKILQNRNIQERRKFEQLVKEFAIKYMSDNSQLALKVLKEACSDTANISTLSSRYPEFNQFAKKYV